MRVDENDHSSCVNAWMERAVNGSSLEQMIQAFEQGFAALWRRAHQTLGDVTLTAIADRVLYTSAERYPMFLALELELGGLRCQQLREHAASLHESQLVEGIRFVLVEFLTVLGNLTADILTPSLHAALSKVALAERNPDDKKSRGEPQGSGRERGEDAKS